MIEELKPKYQIPPTRLPFVNGQIAQIKRDGANWLVSAIWGGTSGGKLYFWNPITQQHTMRPLPDGSPGAYMLQTARDGRLYIGDGRGDLWRYDPDQDQFTSLVRGKMHNITWGGCVTDRYVVWTASPGDATVYDWIAQTIVQVFSPVDESPAPAHYGHSVLEAPDDKVILFMHTPALHPVVLDLKHGMARHRPAPECLKNTTWVTMSAFIGADKIALIMSESGKVLGRIVSYPQFNHVADAVPPPAWQLESRGVVIGRSYYSVTAEPLGALVRWDLDAGTWTMLDPTWAGSDGAYLGTYEGTKVAGITTGGKALLYDPSTGASSTMDVGNEGHLAPYAVCVVPEASIIVGSPYISSSFWTIDMLSGQGQDRGRAMPGGGQINQVVWDFRHSRALLSVYTAAAVMEFDPARPGQWPENPHLVTAAGEEQMRPMALKFDGRYAWMATSPNYGKLGGAISRIDLDTHQIAVWRNLVPDQRPIAIVLDGERQRLFFSTDIYADCESAPPLTTAAEVAAFDMRTLKLIRRRPVRDGVQSVGVVCLLPGGKVLVQIGREQLAWDVDADTLEPLAELAAPIEVAAVDEQGRIWASVGDSIGRLSVTKSAIRFEPVIAMRGAFLQIANNTLYWASSTGIYVQPIEQI